MTYDTETAELISPCGLFFYGDWTDDDDINLDSEDDADSWLQAAAGTPSAPIVTTSNLSNAAKAPTLSSSNAWTTLSAKANSNASTFGGATAYTVRQQQNQMDGDLLEDASKRTSFYTDHIDSDQVAHASVRWMPQQGFFDGRRLSDLSKDCEQLQDPKRASLLVVYTSKSPYKQTVADQKSTVHILADLYLKAEY